MEHFLVHLTPRQKKLLLAALLGGGTALATLLRSAVKNAQKEQRSITKDLETKESQKEKITVDRTFWQRLLKILSICVPSLFSKEAGLVITQGVLLVVRTLLTLEISKLEGLCAKYLTSQQFPMFHRTSLRFAAIGIPTAIVNSLLKYVQKRLQISFQKQLTKQLHAKYCSNRGYYTAAVHGSLTNPDQRLTEDVDKFAYSITELYGYTFKPLLDVILYTRALARNMGYKGQFAMYAYYVLVAFVLKALSPPLTKMAAQEASLSGTFRAAHQRLSANAEEVAYNDPPAGISEELILNDNLQSLLRYVELSAFQRSVQQVFEGYSTKYLASVVTLMIYALPIQLQEPEKRGNQGVMTQDYIRCIRLLQHTARGIGDLILVYKRMTTLAAHTSRVSVLLEQIDNLAQGASVQDHSVGRSGGLSEKIESWMDDVERRPQRICGNCLKFDRVALVSPDRTLLVKNLTFEVASGQSVLIMGPNGSGKTSLVRALAGLWPLQEGTITTPPRSEVFYLSQRAYLVTGTLRDQLLYPDPPRQTWAKATRSDKRRFANIRGRGVGAVDETRLLACLVAVELDYLLVRGQGWNQQQKWEETLSGGEKQRIAFARLLYHKPKFAVLDEATSAVNAEGEQKLYSACRNAGIAILSIGHRPSLREFHHTVIHFGVDDVPQGWKREELCGGRDTYAECS